MSEKEEDLRHWVDLLKEKPNLKGRIEVGRRRELWCQ